MVPWGFTVHHHDFGGACLVSAIDTLSLADAVVSTICPVRSNEKAKWQNKIMQS